MTRRVVITGMSALSSIGSTPQDYLDVISGNKTPPQASADFPCFSLNDWPVKRAFFVPGYAKRPKQRLQQMLDNLSLGACQNALVNERPRCILGIGNANVAAQDIVDCLQDYDFEGDPHFNQLSHFLSHSVLPTDFDLKTPNTILLSTACTSGAQAIGLATRMIKRGDHQQLLCGAVDSFASEIVYAGFCMLGLMSPDGICRPFDSQRNGFVAGEGGAMFILEDLDHALARKATIIAEVHGYGESNNAYRVTDLPEDGEGAYLCMKAAADEARRSIDYVNAHGTGTQKNDAVEIHALARLAADLGQVLSVSSTKSIHGHLIAAAGAIEIAMCVYSLLVKQRPPCHNLVSTDFSNSSIAFVKAPDHLPPPEVVMSNSFGFGGGNASVILGVYKA